MKAEEESFYSQFQKKQVDTFTVVKQAATADNEIEAITGSTITSAAMANGCNEALDAADWVTSHCDEDGVAKAIEKYCFNE